MSEDNQTQLFDTDDYREIEQPVVKHTRQWILYSKHGYLTKVVNHDAGYIDHAWSDHIEKARRWNTYGWALKQANVFISCGLETKVLEVESAEGK